MGADALAFGAREGGGGSASGEKCLYVLAFGGSEVATKPVKTHSVTCTPVTPYKGQHRPQASGSAGSLVRLKQSLATNPEAIQPKARCDSDTKCVPSSCQET